MVRCSWQQVGVVVAVAWVLLTLGHFLMGGAATTTHPTPVPVGEEQVREQVVEREEEGKGEDDEGEEEEGKGEDDEGKYEAWWSEQVERRVRVAETCAREGISQVASCSFTSFSCSSSSYSATYSTCFSCPSCSSCSCSCSCSC